jgi:hypothetical protein
MKELITTIEINATPEKIWKVLVDFEKYHEWNPFIKHIRGDAEVGKKIEAKIHPPGQRDMIFKPILLKVDKNKELRWIGHLLFPGIFDGEHIFLIEKLDKSRILFRHEEKFSGILVPILWKSLYQHTRVGFIEMNQALKKRVENLP